MSNGRVDYEYDKGSVHIHLLFKGFYQIWM